MEIQMTDKNGIRLLTKNKMVKENIEIIPVFDELEIVQAPGNSTTAVMSQKASSNLFANSLTGKKSGVAVSIDDIAQSSITVVNTRSKNLISYPYQETTKTVNGITFTDNGDGSVTVKGTASDGAGFNLYYNPIESLLPQGSTIVVSGGVGSLDTSDRVDIFVAKIKADGTRLNFLGSPLGTLTGRIEEGEKLVQVNIWVRTGMTVDTTIYPQLEYGTVATPYTPYVADDTPITVKSYGKNLLDDSIISSNNLIETDEYGGGLVVDGHSFTAKGVAGGVNGANAGQFMFPYANVNSIKERGVKIIPNKQYAVSFDVLIKEYGANGTQIACIVYHITKGTLEAFHTEKVTGLEVGVNKHISFSFVAPNNSESDRIGITFRLNNQYLTISNVVVEIGATATAYEPYIEGETIQTILVDGAQLESISPNMVITTDNNGVMLDVEYKRDTNIAFEKLEKRLLSLETAIAIT